tara:strand:+ start:1565 stop:1840 length:276 start_codon:yes stop_codon:yes gene_type:complete
MTTPTERLHNDMRKQTESYEQLLARFRKRTDQLSKEQGELDEAYEKWLKLDRELNRLEGSIQAIEYCAYGKLPGDGNHDGMKDHTPKAHNM